MDLQLVEGINTAYAERADPLVFALTGRTGSGCTTAAASLCKPISEISMFREHLDGPEARKFLITTEYARAQWVPFTAITVSSVIYSFLLDESRETLDRFLTEKNVSRSGCDELHEHLRKLREHSDYPA